MNTSHINRETLLRAHKLLRRYRSARSEIDLRIMSDEEFFSSRHKARGSAKSSDLPLPSSAWMFSSIVNKHADMMENIPSPICLAREKSDEPSAESLNSVLPVIFDRLCFSDVYSRAQYDKLKHGTAVYGVFWNPEAENGLGDIEICTIDILNLYTEPGVKNIEDSQNVFYISLMDEEDYLEKYPFARDNDETSDFSNYFTSSVIEGKRVIVDWYYKKKVGTRVVLHYIKFSNSTLLYASEDDEAMQNGFYAHGRYPFVFDILYSEKDFPVGYGLISVTRTTQSYIDKLDENLLERSLISAKPRYMLKKNVGLDKDAFADFNQAIIEVEGDLSEERIKAISLPALDGAVLDVRNSKIDEMREAAANRTVNYGEAGKASSGVAVAALQEAGNKVSRDMQRGAWSSFVEVTKLVIELIREFYTVKRIFRIKAPNSEGYEYVSFSNNGIRESEFTLGNKIFRRRPVFDIDVKADKTSVFSRITRNETILNLCSMGLFDYENTDKALIVLESIELEGKSRIIEMLKSRKKSFQKGEESSMSKCSRDKLKQALGSAVKLYD